MYPTMCFSFCAFPLVDQNLKLEDFFKLKAWVDLLNCIMIPLEKILTIFVNFSDTLPCGFSMWQFNLSPQNNQVKRALLILLKMKVLIDFNFS